MNEFVVKLSIEYKKRDGSSFFIRAKKKFRENFVPSIGWLVKVEDEDREISAEVTSIWWDTITSGLVVNTRQQLYSDGNVQDSCLKHTNHLQLFGWEVRFSD